MLLKVFCILDVKANAYVSPMYFRRVEEAQRSFSISANDPKSDYFNYAEDYVLCEIGTYDDDTGLHSPLPAPVHVISAAVASTRHRDFYASHAIMDSDLNRN